jgi:multimeric flavodoxin WrbA
MKRILGIIGSPRRNGNTHILVGRLLEGAREVGAHTETLFLGGLRIEECDGCHACWRDHPCPKNDDMNALYPAISAADVIVFGTPVYWFGPTALMKAFIDRFVYFNSPANRPGVAGKSAAIVIPLEDTDPLTWEPVVRFFEQSLGWLEMNLAGTLIAPGAGKKGEIRNFPEKLEEAYEMGRTIARSQ